MENCNLSGAKNAFCGTENDLVSSAHAFVWNHRVSLKRTAFVGLFRIGQRFTGSGSVQLENSLKIGFAPERLRKLQLKFSSFAFFGTESQLEIGHLDAEKTFSASA